MKKQQERKNKSQNRSYPVYPTMLPIRTQGSNTISRMSKKLRSELETTSEGSREGKRDALEFLNPDLQSPKDGL